MSAKSTSKKVKSVATPAAEVLAVGTPVKFLGYASGEPGELDTGKTYYVSQYWPDDNLYDLTAKPNGKKALDSAAPEEFEVVSVTNAFRLSA